MKLVPRFDKKPRLYTIDFYDEDYPNTINKLFSINATYSQTLHDAIKTTSYAPFEFYNYNNLVLTTLIHFFQANIL